MVRLKTDKICCITSCSKSMDLQGSFTLEKRGQQCIDYRRHTVRRDKIVLMLVSGGADSVVCASQCDNSSRVQAIHIDNGFLCKDEYDQVGASLQQLGLNLWVVKASLTSTMLPPTCVVA